MGDSSDRSRTRTRATSVVLTSAPMTTAMAAAPAIKPFLAKEDINKIVAVELCRKKVTKIPEANDTKRFFVPKDIMRFR